MQLALSMATFALAASISPGPVNLVALNAGARYGLVASLAHVGGATLGFILLLLPCGLGLHEVLALYPGLTRALQWAGVLFLLYLAWRLAADNGQLDSSDRPRPPSLTGGALMQWLNPKAWLASVAGMGAFAADGDRGHLWLFASIYFVVCFVSIGCWAWMGSVVRGHLQHPAGVRLFNRILALSLVGCAAYLVTG
ncbi:LysE family translocator [Pseudomonas sp. TE3610]